MLKHLDIRNYILIDELRMDFDDKLNILTGETGSGKSIILGAMGLIMGKRADTKTLKNTEKKCIIEAHFQLSSDFKTLFEQLDFEFEPETIIRREILTSGKSRSFVNDGVANLKQLQVLAKNLVSIHQQFDTQNINSPDYQLSLIDKYGENHALLADFQTSYFSLTSLKEQKAALLRQHQQLKKDSQLNNFLLQEFDELGLSVDDLKIHMDLELLEKSDALRNTVQKTTFLITEGDNTIEMQLRELYADYTKLNIDLGEFGEIRNRLIELTEGLVELVRDAENLTGKLDSNPEVLERLRERSGEIFNLQRKHQVNSIEELLEMHQKLANSTADFEKIEGKISELEEKIELTQKQVDTKADKLSSSRMAVFSDFIKSLEDILRDLSMPNIKLDIRREALENCIQTGSDSIEFYVSINKGFDMQALKEVASGGEMSRMALAVNSMMSDKLRTRTLVFDEIDTGVSGEISSKMGDLLVQISQNRQVIGITHSPQIASKGNKHWKVYKRDLENETITDVTQLEYEQRVNEIADMMSGAQRSEAAIENARFFLNQEN